MLMGMMDRKRGWLLGVVTFTALLTGGVTVVSSAQAKEDSDSDDHHHDHHHEHHHHHDDHDDDHDHDHGEPTDEPDDEPTDAPADQPPEPPAETPDPPTAAPPAAPDPPAEPANPPDAENPPDGGGPPADSEPSNPEPAPEAPPQRMIGAEAELTGAYAAEFCVQVRDEKKCVGGINLITKRKAVINFYVPVSPPNERGPEIPVIFTVKAVGISSSTATAEAKGGLPTSTDNVSACFGANGTSENPHAWVRDC